MDLSSTSIAIKPQDYWLLWLKHCSTCGDPFFLGGGFGTIGNIIIFFTPFITGMCMLQSIETLKLTKFLRDKNQVD